MLFLKILIIIIPPVFIPTDTLDLHRVIKITCQHNNFVIDFWHFDIKHHTFQSILFSDMQISYQLMMKYWSMKTTHLPPQKLLIQLASWWKVIIITRFLVFKKYSTEQLYFFSYCKKYANRYWSLDNKIKRFINFMLMKMWNYNRRENTTQLCILLQVPMFLWQRKVI